MKKPNKRIVPKYKQTTSLIRRMGNVPKPKMVKPTPVRLIPVPRVGSKKRVKQYGDPGYKPSSGRGVSY